MCVTHKDPSDDARPRALPVGWPSCAAETRGVPGFIFAHGKIDRLLTSSGHFLLQENP